MPNARPAPLSDRSTSTWCAVAGNVIVVTGKKLAISRLPSHLPANGTVGGFAFASAHTRGPGCPRELMAAKNPGVNQSATGPAMVSEERPRKACEHAVVWAKGEYTEPRAPLARGCANPSQCARYHHRPPMVSPDDAAALVLLGGRRRKATRAQVVHCECDGDASCPVHGKVG